MRVVVVGAHGFVGSAFVRHFRSHGDEAVEVTRANYAEHVGKPADLVVDAAGNSRKFWAEERPFEEFDASVGHRLRSLRDFPGTFHVHLSSVDVYNDLSSPAMTREDASAVGGGSHYGFHKLLAEQLVRRYAGRWLILRLAGMIGPGLRKNPVFDVLHRKPIRIHPDSQYQFMPTADVAALTAQLVTDGVHGEIFNVCGQGLISPREIAALANLDLDLSVLAADASPRIVNIDIAKSHRRWPIPSTVESVRAFLAACR